MKIKDYISRSIQEYPSMYKDVDYEKSKLKVLNHIFFVIGNGLEFARTENPKEGGYICDRSGKNNKPYGKEKYKKIPKDYFESVIYYVYASEYPLEVITKKSRYPGGKTYYRYRNSVDSPMREPRLYKAECLGPFSPYPISEGHSLISEVFYKGAFIQEDWLEEAVFLCERTLPYFKNHDEYSGNPYYPSESRIKKDLKYFEDTFADKGEKGVADLRKTWGYPVNENVPTYEEILRKKVKTWEKFQKEQIGFLEKFIKKFKK
jgi:hypothetical protein